MSSDLSRAAVAAKESLVSLKAYCEAEEFRGWDPYDGLNSRLFQATPLRKSALARLCLIQFCKRSPINFRRLLAVPKGHNAKGVALLLNGYCNLLRLARAGQGCYGSEDSLLSKVNALADLLISLEASGYSGACWGYNFGWQARRLFYFPPNTPTVVATSFCANALFNAYSQTGNSLYLDRALSSAEFVLRDLRRTPCDRGFILSYSPIPGNDTVYNASLLGAKLLSRCFHYTGRAEYSAAAREIVMAACDAQATDGSWVYGALPVQSWIDSFHTGYNLDAIACYAKYCSDGSVLPNLNRGLEFYLSKFFMSDGTPKYYHDRVYPVDIHCPGQLWVTLSEVGRFKENAALCASVVSWTIREMQDERGFFYYQLRRGISSRIPYMRWSCAFMFNALSYYLLEMHGE